VERTPLYLGGPWSKSQSGDHLFWQKFIMVFLSLCRQILELYHKLSSVASFRILSNSRFTLSSYHSVL
jgi:hypothetical protein